MKIVILMLRRSMLRRKSFAAAVVLLSGALTLIVATAVASVAANSSRYDEACAQTDSPDTVLSFPSAEFDSADAAYFEHSSLVERATVTRAYQGTVENAAHKPTSILVVPASTLAGSLAEDGDHPGPGPGEAFLPLYLKSSLGLSAGGRVTVNLGPRRVSYRIAGFYQDTVFGSPIMRYKRIAVSDAAYADLRGRETAEYLRTRTLVELHDRKTFATGDTSVATEQLLSGFPGRYRAEFAYDKGFIRRAYIMIPSVLASLLGAVAASVALITFLAIRYVTVTSIELDRPEIATMKSLGFPGHQVRLVLALQFGLLTSVGAILGALGSLVTAPALTRVFLASNGILPGDLHLSPAPWLVAAGVVTAGNLVVLNSTRHALKVAPIAVSRDRRSLWTRRRSPTITLQRLSRLPLNLRIAVRQVLAHPSQYLALGLSCLLFGFLLTVISGVTLRFTDAQVVASSLGLPHADLSVSVLDPHQDPDAAAESVAERLARQQPITYVSSFEQMNISVAGTQVIAMVYGSFPPDAKPEQGRLPRAAGDIMISSYLADRLGTGVGDTLQVAADSSRPRPFTITGIYQSVNNVGLTVELLRSGYTTVNPGHRFTHYLVDYAKTPQSTVLDDVVAAEASRGMGIQVERGDKAIANLVSTVQTSLKLLDVLLLVIALTVSGVITTFLALTAVVKETTDLGVMKVMGYPSRILRRHLSARFLVVTSAGTLAGELLAGLLGSRVLGLVLKSAGLSRLDVTYRPAVVVGVFCAMTVVTLAVATLATRNVTKVSLTTLVTE